jgi:hypothetical protein
MKLKTILTAIVLIIISYFFRREHMKNSPILTATETTKKGSCPKGSTELDGSCYSCPTGRILSGGKYCT